MPGFSLCGSALLLGSPDCFLGSPMFVLNGSSCYSDVAVHSFLRGTVQSLPFVFQNWLYFQSFPSSWHHWEIFRSKGQRVPKYCYILLLCKSLMQFKDYGVNMWSRLELFILWGIQASFLFDRAVCWIPAEGGSFRERTKHEFGNANIRQDSYRIMPL